MTPSVAHQIPDNRRAKGPNTLTPFVVSLPNHGPNELIPFVVSLSNHGRNQRSPPLRANVRLVQSFLEKSRRNGAFARKTSITTARFIGA